MIKIFAILQLRKGLSSMSEVKCKKCGCEIKEGMKYCLKCSEKKKNVFKNKKVLIIIGIVILMEVL